MMHFVASAATWERFDQSRPLAHILRQTGNKKKTKGKRTWYSIMTWRLNFQSQIRHYETPVDKLTLFLGSTLESNQLCCLSYQVIPKSSNHTLPTSSPVQVKEHIVSPVHEKTTYIPLNDDNLQNVGDKSMDSCAHITVCSKRTNKGPRSRTKVPNKCFGLFINGFIPWHLLSHFVVSIKLFLGIWILPSDLSESPRDPTELHPRCWTLPWPGGYIHFVGTTRPSQTHHHQVFSEPALLCEASWPSEGARWGTHCHWRSERQWIQRGGVAFRLRGRRVKWRCSRREL